jgi:hypothetical protein
MGPVAERRRVIKGQFPDEIRVIKDPLPKLTGMRRAQRVWLPPPPGGFRHPKPKRRKLSSESGRKLAALLRIEAALSRAGVIVMGVVLVAVVVVLVILVATRL